MFGQLCDAPEGAALRAWVAVWAARVAVVLALVAEPDVAALATAAPPPPTAATVATMASNLRMSLTSFRLLMPLTMPGGGVRVVDST